MSFWGRNCKNILYKWVVKRVGGLYVIAQIMKLEWQNFKWFFHFIIGGYIIWIAY